jgi:hypothetical protein
MLLRKLKENPAVKVKNSRELDEAKLKTSNSTPQTFDSVQTNSSPWGRERFTPET